MNGKTKNPLKPDPMSVFVSVFERTAVTAADSTERAHFLNLAILAKARGTPSADGRARPVEGVIVEEAYVEAITRRTFDLLVGLDPLEQRAAMDELARAATEGGLILDETSVRQTNELQFAIDLFEGNPAALDFLNAKVRYCGMSAAPSQFESLEAIASELRPSRR